MHRRVTLFPVSTSDGADLASAMLEVMSIYRLVNTGAMFTLLPTTVNDSRLVASVSREP
jgi:hypothetical protein